jgi:LacI family transcriptional regulator
MTRRVTTIKDVAKAASVSIGTVSAVIHGKGSVNAEMRSRVEAAVAELGYTPNSVAQSMRLGSTRTIGLLVAHLNAPGITDFISAAQNVLDEAGYAMLLAPYTGNRDRELKLIEILRRRKVDGVLIYPMSEHDAAMDSALTAINVPVVVVDRESERWDTVVVEHRRAIQRATEHLLQMGHRRIAFMAGTRSIYPSRERLLGYEAAHEAFGIPVDPDLIRSGDYLADYGFRETSVGARRYVGRLRQRFRPDPATHTRHNQRKLGRG